MAWLGILTVVLGLIALRQSLPIVLLVAAIYIHLVWGDGNATYLIEDMWNAVDNSLLLSIPMFLLAGAIMARGSIAQRLIEVVKQGTIWLRGGMGVATILSCALFAAISGSSAVTMLAIGAVLYPALTAAGYSKTYSLGALTSAGTLGIIIPPSIPLIIFGIVNERSILDLFIAGIVPGLLLTTVLAGYSFWTNRHLPAEPFDPAAFGRALARGGWAMVMPIVLLGGIYTGWFSPTEAAAVAIFYALIVELFIHREMNLRDYFDVVVETSRLLGTLIMLIAVIVSMQQILTILGVQQAMGDWVVSVFESKIAFLIAVNVLLLIVGCFLDAISAILILSPLLLGPAMRLGIDPVHFAIIMVVNLEIGLLTPPVGLNLIVAMAAFKERFGLIVRGALPFVGLMIVALLIVTFVPELSLFLLG